MEERPKTIPERRGMAPIPRDRTKAYKRKSYAAQYGITVEDAEDLIAEFGNNGHKEIDRAIQRMFSRDRELKDRALNWHLEEEEKTRQRHQEIERERKKARQERIEEAKREEAEKERAAKELKKEEEK